MFAYISCCRITPLVLAFVACCLGGCAKTAALPQRDTKPPKSSANEQQAQPEKTDESTRRILVAKVLGKEIFEDDLVPPANDDGKPATLTDEKLKHYREGTLFSLIWQPLMDKYCIDHHIQPTNEEVEKYKASMENGEPEPSLDEEIQSLKNSLESGDLSDSDKRDTSELLALLQAEGTETYDERMIRFLRSKLNEKDLGEEKRRRLEQWLTSIEFVRDLPKNMVRSWKFDRALYAEYGGVVIFQQANPREPVGAYRKWLEAHEQAGDFTIVNDAARAAFWEYFKRDWEGTNVEVHEPDPLGQPWWLRKPTDEDAKEEAEPVP